MKIEYIHEPTDLQCGQAVLAMLIGTGTENICSELKNERETTLREMKQMLEKYGFKLSPERKQAAEKTDLPSIALLSLETPRCWHWSLYAEGVFYDPEHGVMLDFPECKRRYFWEVIESKEKLPFSQKSVAELVLEMNKALEDVPEITEEELIEDDAEGGYFDDLEYYAEDD